MGKTSLLTALVCAALTAAACKSDKAETPPKPAQQPAQADPTPAPAAPAAPQLGNTRDSVVALPMPSGPQPVVYLTSERTDEQLATLKKLGPNVKIVAGLTRETALKHAKDAHGVDAHLMTSEFLQQAKNLRWAQSWSAGVERYIALPEITARDEVILTNMKGMHGPVIAEHVFAMLLSLTRNLAFYQDAMKQARWDRRGGAAGMTALHGKTMLVVGMGGIGSEIAKRAHGLGMRVIATVRTQRPAPPYVDKLGTAEALDAMLPEADVVALAVPLTDQTRGLINRDRLAAMKDGAYLVNIARGQVVDTAALLEALDSGKLAGACLDVTDPEPLPPEHPLWKRDNVLITPHVSSRAELTSERRWTLFQENFRKFATGEPLINVVDKAAGY